MSTQKWLKTRLRVSSNGEGMSEKKHEGIKERAAEYGKNATGRGKKRGGA